MVLDKPALVAPLVAHADVLHDKEKLLFHLGRQARLKNAAGGRDGEQLADALEGG